MDAESIHDAGHVCEGRADPQSLEDLFVAPAGLAHFLDLLVRDLVSVARLGIDQLQQRGFLGFEPGSTCRDEVSTLDRLGDRFFGSLSTQEVGVGVTSVLAVVEGGNVRRDHLFLALSKKTRAEMAPDK